MKNNNRKWTTFNPTPVQPRYAHYTEENALKSGESAFKIRVPFYANPFKEQPFKSAWIRGYKRAERDYNDMVRFSMKIQESLSLEEVG